MKTQCCFLEKINTMDSHLARLTKINIEKSQITNIRNERRGFITDLMDIKRIIEIHNNSMPANLITWMK